VSASGAPLLGSLWFAFERGRFWFSSAADSPLPRAARRGALAAVIVDDFDPPASIRQVRIRGRAQIEPHDPAMVTRIYRRYLGRDIGTWPKFFQSRIHQADGWLLWSVYPDSGLAVTSPGFDEHIAGGRRLMMLPSADRIRCPSPTRANGGAALKFGRSGRRRARI
jgi:Pyridoxamine 5'-phosphate oxidase